MVDRLDELLGEPRWRSAQGLPTRATAAAGEAALRALRPRDLPVTGMLTSVRGLPAVVTGRRRRRGDEDRPLLERMRAIGLVPLVNEPGRGVVLGLIGQPWRRRAEAAADR